MDAGDVRIVRAGPLHRFDGLLSQRGWATSQVLTYRRAVVRTSRRRIREWDRYMVNDADYAVLVTLGDLGYVGLVSVSLIDFVRIAYRTTSIVTPFPLGRFRLPESSSSGISAFENGRVSIRFDVQEGVRSLRVRFARFDGDEALTFEAVLDDGPQDSIVVAAPWQEDQKAFCYSQKTIGMRARGSFKKGLLIHGFNPADSLGLLDWHRGVWARGDTWLCGIAQGWQDGRGGSATGAHRFGFNVGYRLGDESMSGGNALFVDGIAHKIGRVDLGIPERRGPQGASVADRYDFTRPWRMADGDGRIDLTFTPVLERADRLDCRLVSSDEHQVFGLFSGTTVLDDGSPFAIENLYGSMEVSQRA